MTNVQRNSQFSTARDLALAIRSHMEGKVDYVKNTSNVEMALEQDGDTGHYRPVLDFTADDTGHRYHINSTAHQQIGGRLGIPAKYYEAMMNEAPSLLADNVNHWLHSKPETRLIRTLQGTGVRAFLSDRYSRIENEEVFETIYPLLEAHPDMQLVASAITDDRMYIKATFPRIAGEVTKGDVVQAGIIISNSEVGKGAVSIRPLIYRLVCLNGMVIEDAKYSARHLGGRLEEDAIAHLLSDQTKRLQDVATLSKIKDVVNAALDENTFRARLLTMQQSTEQTVENPAKAVEVLAKKVNLNEREQASVLTRLIEGDAGIARGEGVSRWNLINAVTRAAQDVGNFDRATELEAVGGQLLNIRPADWQPIAQAA